MYYIKLNRTLGETIARKPGAKNKKNKIINQWFCVGEKGRKLMESPSLEA